MSSKSAPRRRVERVRSRIIDTSVSNSAEQVVLHSAEDSKTLIRAMGLFKVSPIDIAMVTTVFMEALLAINPGAATVVSLAVSQELDADVPLAEIGRWSAEAMQNDTNGIITTDTIAFDTKAMRKFKPGDDVVLKYIASTASDLRLRGTIYLWFKE